MRYPGKGLLALAVLCAALGASQASGPPVALRRANDAAARLAADEAHRTAAKIDEFIDAGIAKHKIKPAATAGDSAFLRRASLDIVGKTQFNNDVRKFLADPSPEKRAEAVQRLLDSPGYVNNFTNIWRDLLIPEAKADLQRRYLLPGMDQWLRKQFTANVPYDQMVRDLVAAPMSAQPNQMYFYGRQGNDGTPMSFYLAKQAKPEELATSITRVFLGIRLECAQCHDHPKGSWRREEFWSQAAFFAGLKGQQNGDFFYGPIKEAQDRRELNIPNTDRVAQARFLDGKQPRWKFKVGARTSLAEWMTAKDNPYFAKAIVNRMWAHFFGIGLVDPLDDMVEDNLPSHPELLDMLAREFINHDFDLKFLIRAITSTRAYQRSSVYDPENPSDVRAVRTHGGEGNDGGATVRQHQPGDGLPRQYASAAADLQLQLAAATVRREVRRSGEENGVSLVDPTGADDDEQPVDHGGDASGPQPGAGRTAGVAVHEQRRPDRGAVPGRPGAQAAPRGGREVPPLRRTRRDRGRQEEGAVRRVLGAAQ